MDDHGERQQPGRQGGSLEAAGPGFQLPIDEHKNRKQHPPGRTDGLPRHPHVGPVAPCRDVPGRHLGGCGSGLACLAAHHGVRMVRRRHRHGGGDETGDRL